MKHPRGHASYDGFLRFMFCLFGIPFFALVALIVLPILKIWCSFSWWWMIVPVIVIMVWWATIQIMGMGR